MPLAQVYSRATGCIDAALITIEADISPGLPAFSIVGLPATAVKESKDRIRSAIMNCGFEFPSQRITINLAPADIPKGGCSLDLPIAIGILAASEQISHKQLANYEFFAELALSGDLRPSCGLLVAAIATRAAERILITCSENAAEAALPSGSQVIASMHLLDVCAHLQDNTHLAFINAPQTSNSTLTYPDLADVRGQEAAKRALEIAACGQHSLLMCGPPGSGKTMLAARLVGLLPQLSEQQALECAAIRSVAGHDIDPKHWCTIPYRAPHHTASAIALVGGGNPPRPGDISLAHNGVLFLDELPEFQRQVLESLREPLESGHINISRAGRHVQFPAYFQLIAAMNPCPCGYAGSAKIACRCHPDQIQRYKARLSGPLLDRIDIHLAINPVDHNCLTASAPSSLKRSSDIRQKVIKVRSCQTQRQGHSNSLLNNQQIQQYCQLDQSAEDLMKQAIEKWQLSARAYHRILRIARTIADMDGNENIQLEQLAEALSYRCQ